MTPDEIEYILADCPTMTMAYRFRKKVTMWQMLIRIWEWLVARIFDPDRMAFDSKYATERSLGTGGLSVTVPGWVSGGAVSRTASIQHGLDEKPVVWAVARKRGNAWRPVPGIISVGQASGFAWADKTHVHVAVAHTGSSNSLPTIYEFKFYLTHYDG